jgi:nitrile hydratase accessory protein
VFGITLALHEAGRFEWSEFQARLIQAIAAHEAELEAQPAGEGGEYHYYGCWLKAFRTLAADKGWLDLAVLDGLEDELVARPAGHDH